MCVEGAEGTDVQPEEAEAVEAEAVEAELEEAEERGKEGGGGAGGRGRLFDMVARHDMAILVVSVLPAPLSPLTRMDCAPPGQWVVG